MLLINDRELSAELGKASILRKIQSEIPNKGNHLWILCKLIRFLAGVQHNTFGSLSTPSLIVITCICYLSENIWLGRSIIALKADGKSSTRNSSIMEWQSRFLWNVFPISMKGNMTTPGVGTTSWPMSNVDPKLCWIWESETLSLSNISFNITFV